MADLRTVDVRCGVRPASPLYANMPLMRTCREHRDDAASLAIYPDHIHCYGCGFTIARRMESLAYVLGVPLNEAIARAAEFVGVTNVPAVEKKPDPLSMAVAVSYERLLWGYRKDRLEWLHDRGLSDETIKRFRLGHDGTRYTIPFFENGKLASVRFRSDPRSQIAGETYSKYAGMYGRNSLRLYGAWELRGDEDMIVVCEGEFDAMRLWQEGIPAVSPTNGAGSLGRVMSLLSPHASITHLYIASDQDAAGEAGAQDLLTAAEEAGVSALRLTWPRAMGKDVTELFLTNKEYAHGTFEQRRAVVA